jgi:hypothetical protein
VADPYTTPIPGAVGYESATLAAKTAYQNALTRLNQQRGDTLRQFGYAGDINPDTGVVGNIRVDPNLPYGEYQQERQSHADAYEQARQSAQDRGIGRGGLAARGVTRLRQGFGAEDAALGQNLSGAISGYQDQQNQAAYQRDAALSEAQLQATRDAIQQQMFNQANLDGLDTPDGPDWASIINDLLSNNGGSSDPNAPGGGTRTPVGGGVQTRPGGPVRDSAGGVFDPRTGTYTLPKKQAPKAAPKSRVSSVPPDLRPKPAPPAPKPAPKPKPKKK